MAFLILQKLPLREFIHGKLDTIILHQLINKSLAVISTEIVNYKAGMEFLKNRKNAKVLLRYF